MNCQAAGTERIFPSVSVLGVSVTPVTVEQLMSAVETAIGTRHQRYVIGNHNLHSISLYRRRPRMREFYNRADLVFVDGMPIIAHARLLGIRVRRCHRTTVLDWLEALMKMSSESGWRVVFIGGKAHVAERARDVLTSRFRGLELHVHHGYFDTSAGAHDNERVIAHVRELRPDVLLVGMGMPRQEEWIFENLSRLDANVILPIGAGMDYIADAIPTPPRWLGSIGLEWLYRLLSEPGRLSSRYLIEPWSLVPLALADYVAKIKGKEFRGALD